MTSRSRARILSGRAFTPSCSDNCESSFALAAARFLKSRLVTSGQLQLLVCVYRPDACRARLAEIQDAVPGALGPALALDLVVLPVQGQPFIMFHAGRRPLRGTSHLPLSASTK